MIRIQVIETLDLPELAPYRTLRRPLEHQRQGIFVAEGEKVVRRLLESGFEVQSVLLPDKWLAGYESLLQGRPEPELPVYVVREKKVLEELVGFSMFQGVLAVGRIPASCSLEDAIARSAAPRLFAAVDALTNAENLGALVRNCVAFGVQALLVGETSSSPFLRRAVRNSMGTLFQLPVVETDCLADTLRILRSRSVRCVAAHPNSPDHLLSRTDFSGDLCVVFGSEGYGLSPEVLSACDAAASIPMSGTVDSLNVAAAAAVFLYEVNRQRGRV